MDAVSLRPLIPFSRLGLAGAARIDCASAYVKYCQSASSDRKPDKTSFMPVIQATGSTCRGCRANNKAPAQAAQCWRIRIFRTAKTTNVLRICMSPLAKWNTEGPDPEPPASAVVAHHTL